MKADPIPELSRVSVSTIAVITAVIPGTASFPVLGYTTLSAIILFPRYSPRTLFWLFSDTSLPFLKTRPETKTQLLSYQPPDNRYMTKKRMYVCSVEAAMDVIGGKWKSLILWKIKDAPLRFGEIQEKLPNISQKMLTRQLRALEEDRLVSRREYPGMPPHVEYSLTARGQTVIPLLVSLKEWATEELADQIAESG
jgi:DNA-binding HxlR family transcriptional regulator